MEKDKTEQQERRLLISLGVLVGVLVILAIVGIWLIKPAEVMVQGQADATSVRISGKLPGRVTEFYVTEGEKVRKGDTLVHIHSSTADAMLYQAQSMEEATSAQNRKVDAGTRTQIINSARDFWIEAKAALSIAEKTYNRMENLYRQGVVSEQKRDEAYAAYTAAGAQVAAAKSQYDMALEGVQREDKESARAMTNAAKGSVMEVQSILEDQFLIAPCDGEISVIYPNVGELVAMGAPIMSVLEIDNMWISFNVREELLNELPLNKEVEVMIPALGMLKTRTKVFYIADMGSYAMWTATKAADEYDSKTFEVKLRPIEHIPNLRPGMSAILVR